MIEGRRRNFLFAVLLLALVLFNAPVLIVMDAVGGGGYLPVLLFVGWALVILLAAWAMRGRVER